MNHLFSLSLDVVFCFPHKIGFEACTENDLDKGSVNHGKSSEKGLSLARLEADPQWESPRGEENVL